MASSRRRASSSSSVPAQTKELDAGIGLGCQLPDPPRDWSAICIGRDQDNELAESFDVKLLIWDIQLQILGRIL